MAQRHVIDARNLLDRHDLESRGFTYSGVGVQDLDAEAAS